MDERQIVTNQYALYNGDCMDIMGQMADESLHLSLYSPPFGGMYIYSGDDRDLSNRPNYNEFFNHYRFIEQELHRVTMPGRMSAVHCMDIPRGGCGNRLRYFPGDIIRMNDDDGWDYVARYHVWKEPLTVRNRTMMKSLHHKTVCENSTQCAAAGADYLLIFRKRGDNPIPVTKQNGFLDYAGERVPPSDILHYRGWDGNQIENKYSQWVWQQYASAFWDDVRLNRVLPVKDAREEDDEKHVHPLQLDVIERACILWSNPKEIVFTPFMGVGSEVFGAVSNDRFGIGVELKASYYRQAVKNLAEVNVKVQGLGL